MLFLWEKQQFTCTHKMMDDLICSVENFKALIEFKGKYFDGDRQAQWTVPQKELCKNYEGFGTEEFLKTANEADQTNLEARYLTIAETDLMHYYWSSNSGNTK